MTLPALMRLQGNRRYRWLRRGVMLVIFAGIVGGGIAGWPWIRNTLIPLARTVVNNDEKVSTGSVKRFEKHNFSFAFPDKDWKDDKGTGMAVQANIAMRRTDPNAWMALAFRDHKTRNPRDAEVVDEAVGSLNAYFQNFEWDQKTDTKLAGQRAQRLVFQGEWNSIMMSGECYLLTYKGITYALSTWAPAVQVKEGTVEAEFEDLRGRFSLLKEREGWTEKRPPVRTFSGERAAYTLRDTEALWEKWAAPDDADPKADLLLQAKDRVESQDVDKMARVLVLVLPSQSGLPAAVKAARAYLEEQQKREYPATTWEVVSEPQGAEGRPAAVGEAPGRLMKFRVKNGDNRVRFMLLAVVNRPKGVLAIQCECDWNRRSLWERDFHQLIGTFSVKAH
jgi:hypothetical protein